MQNQIKQQEQNKRYEFYICNNPDIYWWTNSIDKPCKEQFDRITRSTNWIKVNTTPNFINPFTAEFVVDKKDFYNYGKLIDKTENKTTYWFFNALQKTLRNAFLYEIKMDVFSSYGYDFLYQVRQKELPAYINRSNSYQLLDSSFVHSQKDELLPDFTGIYPLKMKYQKISQDYFLQIKFDFYENGDVWVQNEKGKIFQMNADDANMNITQIEKDTANRYWQLVFKNTNSDSNAYFDVYAVDNIHLLLVPINNVLNEWKCQNGVYDGNKPTYKVAIFNRSKGLRLRNQPGWVSKYKGCYCIPFFPQVLVRCKGLVDINSGGLSYTGGFFIPISTATERNLNYQVESGSIIKNKVLSRFNPNSIYINEYVLSKFTQFVSGERWCSYFNDKLYGINEYDYNYISGFNIYNTIRFDIDKSNRIVYNCGETLPIITDEYQKYLSASLSSRNTNLEIHNRDASIGIFQSVFSGLDTIIGGATSGFKDFGLQGGIIGGLAGGINAGFDIARAINRYKDYQKRENAALADKKRSSTPTITMSTNDKSNLYHKLNKVKKYGLDGTQTVENHYTYTLWLNGYNETDIKSIKASNRIVWENGYKIGMRMKVNDVGNFPTEYCDESAYLDFLYWDWKFDDEHFRNTFPTLDIDLLNTIKMCINGEIRFWKINKPNLNTEIRTS